MFDSIFTQIHSLQTRRNTAAPFSKNEPLLLPNLLKNNRYFYCQRQNTKYRATLLPLRDPFCSDLTLPKLLLRIACVLLVTATQSGGGERDRTDDPLLAKQVLSQLSYTPVLPRLPGPRCASSPPRGGSGWARTIDPRLIKTVL